MSQAFVALGSNLNPVEQLQRAARALRRQFADVRFSRCYRSAALGFEGPDFINAAATFSTPLPLEALRRRLREIEADCGRLTGQPRLGPQPIDLDLLLFDDRVMSAPGLELPRAEVRTRDYVLRPLSELAPDWLLPPVGPSLGQLWASFAGPRQRLSLSEPDLNA